MFRAAPARSCPVGDRLELRRYGPAISYGQLVVCRVRNFTNVGRFCSHRIAVGVAFRDFAPRHDLSALARRRERRCRFTLQCGTHVLLDFNQLAETEVSLEAFQLGLPQAF